MKTNTVFRRKWSQLHKNDAILHVTISFFLKQGQTRASTGLIWTQTQRLKGNNLLLGASHKKEPF